LGVKEGLVLSAKGDKERLKKLKGTNVEVGSGTVWNIERKKAGGRRDRGHRAHDSMTVKGVKLWAKR